MKKLAMRFKAAWLWAFLSLVPALSFAGGVNCPLATGLVPDGRILDLDYVPPATTVWYSFNTIAGRSYSVEVRDDLDGNPNADFAVSFWSASCGTAMTAVVGPTYTSSQYRNTSTIEPKLVYGTRISVPSPATDTISIAVLNGATLGHYISVSVSETTIYSPAWSAYASFYTQFLIQNTTSQSIDYNLALTATTGGTQTYAWAGTLSGTPAAASSLSVLKSSGTPTPAIVFLNVTQQTGGYATLTHDGPPAAIPMFP